jgi:thiol:disulfide interchange protein DsbD
MSLSVSPLSYLGAFAGGLALSLTPCIYPLIPIVVGYIGISAGSSRLKGFGLSLLYVLGTAFTYSCLGLLASLTGSMFGRIAVSWPAHLILGGIIFVFGLSLLDLFSLPAVSFRVSASKKGYFPVFILGLVSGLAVSPCITPVLGAILAYLAAKQNIFFGSTLLFTFALGMGLPLVLLGTFSAQVINLPKSGKWMVYIKKFFAFILISIGIYFIFTAGVRIF